MAMQIRHDAVTNWSNPSRVGSDTTSSGPRCTRQKNGTNWATWREASDNTVRSSTESATSTDSWSSPTIINRSTAASSPAIAPLNNGVFLVWRNTDNVLYNCYYSGTDWSPVGRTNWATTNYGPALAMYNGLIYLAWSGLDNRIYYMTYDPSTWIWGQATKVSDTYNISGSPALAVSGNALQLAWYDGYQNSIFHCSYSNSQWSPAKAVNGPDTQNGPALASYNGGLALAWRNRSNNSVYYATCPDNADDWSAPTAVPGTQTYDSPGMYGDDTGLQLVWRNSSDNGVWTSALPAGGNPNPPPSTTRPYPPSVDGFLSDQCWGTAQLNTFISGTLTQPDGTTSQLGPVSTNGKGDWTLDLNPQPKQKATLSLTASYGRNGTPSDPFVRVFGQTYSTPVVLSSVGMYSVSGSADAGRKILGWRSSDGAKLVDLSLSTNQTSFNTAYYKNQTLQVNDQLNVVSADPDTGAMTPYTSAPEGFPP